MNGPNTAPGVHETISLQIAPFERATDFVHRAGYMRIQGELLKLGISVLATTIATVLRASGLGPAPRADRPQLF